ncbi:MAG: hypothetical protein RIS17_1854 [Pseudomonadota bacterium]
MSPARTRMAAAPRSGTDRPVRVLIVDDSATMRATLRRILSSDPDIDVVATAPEPHAARALIKDLNPDVITLDIEMPGMDGLAFLERIMRLRPMPVVMVSTLTRRGAAQTIEALRLGAVDCIAKPSAAAGDLNEHARLLCDTVKAAARTALARPMPDMAADTDNAGKPFRDDRLIAIGSSTGGVEALFSLLHVFPANCPPVLVVQHMPAAFTGSFAARLDKDCAVKVVEARHGATLERGTVHIAPGGVAHMALAGGIGGQIILEASDPVGGHRPAVNMLFQSLVPLGAQAVGVILTGMGADGATGLLAMRQAGARTFGQDETSCVVYGMPAAAKRLGAVERELPLRALPRAILAACR